MRHISSIKGFIYLGILFIAVLAISLFSMWDIIHIPYIIESLRDIKSIYMFVELLLVFFLMYFSLLYIKDEQKKVYTILFVTSIFMYLHQIFLAFFIAGIFMLMLILLGEVTLLYIRKYVGIQPLLNISRILHDFLFGSCVYIIYICSLSLLGLGSLRLVRINTILFFLIIILIYILLKIRGKIIYIREKREDIKFKPFCLSIIFTMVLLQIGRANITLDYDSLHYGLRSMYILNNGRGIYEKLGLVNDVYVYPKGLEILTMPLNTYSSYSFILAFSVIIMIALLITVYEIAYQLTGRKNALLTVLFFSVIPAIMNMGISAKTDIITLFIQLIAILDMIMFLKDNKNDTYLLWSILALFQTAIYKPTSFFFSAIILIFNILFILSLRRSCTFKKKYIYICIPFIVNIIMVTARSILYTNYPVTSVFSSIWMKLGIPMKYPFASINALNDINKDFFSHIAHFVYRIKGLFLSPSGDEMSHVLIASPGVIILIFMILNIISAIIFFKKYSTEKKYIIGLFYVVLLSSFYILHIIYQVDGNYFILLYSLSIISFVIAISHLNLDNKKILLGLSPSITVVMFLCAMTNWAGKTGLTDIDVFSKGYYNHRGCIEDELYSQGNLSIYQYLKEDNRNRVIAMAQQPGCLVFSCNVQSYTDIVGSGGNVKLVKTLDNFKEFLDFAQIKYLYTDEAFLEENSRASEIIRYMIEDKSLSNIITEGRYKLYKYN